MRSKTHFISLGELCPNQRFHDSNELSMRAMQESAYERCGEQYLLIKSPPASGISRALMFVALDKLDTQGVKQAIVVVLKTFLGSSFNDELLTKHGFRTVWTVAPKWNPCNSPGTKARQLYAPCLGLQVEGAS